MNAPGQDLWTLVDGRPEVDPTDLANAILRRVSESHEPLDFRTRLLIRDGLNALAHRWGESRMSDWLASSAQRAALERISREELGRPGFPSLVNRLMESTKPQTVLAFLRELGVSLRQPSRVSIGGSASLIVTGKLARRTDDVDVVDEVPAEIRTQRELLDRLGLRYGLRVAHFQSHYLPEGWEGRLYSLGRFGQLDVYLVDVYDVFLSKLFSRREKDRDDLRMLAPQLDQPTIVIRLHDTTASLQAEEPLRQAAADNWYILFGEPLPG